MSHREYWNNLCDQAEDCNIPTVLVVLIMSISQNHLVCILGCMWCVFFLTLKAVVGHGNIFQTKRIKDEV